MHLVTCPVSLQAVLKCFKESQISDETIYNNVYFVSEAFQSTSKERRNICQKLKEQKSLVLVSVDCVHLVLFSVSPATLKALNFYMSS